MPYQYDPLLDDENKDKENTAGGAGEQTQLAGGTQVTGGSTDTQAQSSGGSGAAPTHSDQFQNLNDYLSANEGNGFGGQFAGKVQNDVDSANSAQDNTATQFKQRADAGSTNFDADLTAKAVADPVGFQSDADSLAKFTAQRDANYTGPYTYADTPDLYQQASGAVQKAQDTTQAANSEPGRFALLDNYFGNSQYNQGQKSLDNLLISGDQGAQGQLAQSQQAAAASAQRFNQSQPGLSDYASQRKAATDATKQGVADAFTGTNGAIPTLQNTITQRQADAAAQQAKDLQSMQIAASTKQFNDAQLAQLGLKSGDTLYGVDPNKYLSTQAPTLDAVTTKDELARLNALDSLMGTNNGFTGDASQVGTYDPNNDIGFDSASFQKALQGQAGAYGSAKSDADTRNALDQNIFANEFNPNGGNVRNDPAAQQEWARLAGLIGKTTLSSSDLPALQAAQAAEYQKRLSDLANQYNTRDIVNQQKVMDIPGQLPGQRVIHLKG